MRWFSIFQLTEEDTAYFHASLVSVGIDYQRFSFSDTDTMSRILNSYFPNTWLIDSDNSNTLYVHTGALTRVSSPRGFAYIYTLAFEGIGAVPICFFEIYKNPFGGSVGRIDLYGSFFHFESFLPMELRHLKEDLLSEWSRDHIRCTRTDVALDFEMPYPQNICDIITPSRHAKRWVNTYNDNGVLNSASYLTRKNSWYGVRVYNKILDIKQKGKEFWYDNLPDNLTRVEFEFYPPYSHINDSTQILELVLDRLFGNKNIPVGLGSRPQLWFVVENAYAYFKRYAISKGVSVDFLIEEITKYHLTQKELLI